MSDARGAAEEGGRIVMGSPAFRKANVAVVFCGFSIFAILYCPQPILPQFAAEFDVTPAQSSFALSLSAIAMAFAMLVASSASEVFGRKPLMLGALIGSSVLTMALAFAGSWSAIIWLRALAGVTLSGAPAVTLAYLGEEMAASAVAPAVGLYIGGGALGGMAGRLVTATLADWASWRWAMAVLGAVGLVSAAIFWRTLPPSRHFTPREPSARALVVSMRRCLADRRVGLLLGEGFLLLGAFMAVYNYLGFRLQAPPFNFSQTVAGLVFAIYPVGAFASAYMGKRAARRGRGESLLESISVMIAGLVLMTPDWTPAIALGLALFTFGFFGAHTICSGWAPALVARDKAQAASLYLLSYYVGGGVAGSLGGLFWTRAGWKGVALFAGAMSAATLIGALALRRVAQPL